VRITAPPSWQLSERAGYPNIILRLARRSPDGKLFLAAEPVTEAETSLGYATRTAKMLTQMGFSVKSPARHVGSGAYWLDASRGDRVLRQAYVVRTGIGYSLTLSTQGSRARAQLLRAFDDTLRTLTPLSDSDLRSLEAPATKTDANVPPEATTQPAPLAK